MNRHVRAFFVFLLLAAISTPSPAPPPAGGGKAKPERIDPATGKPFGEKQRPTAEQEKKRQEEVRIENERVTRRDALLERLHLDQQTAKDRLKEYRATSSSLVDEVLAGGHGVTIAVEGRWTPPTGPVDLFEPTARALTYRVLGRKEVGRLPVATALLGPLLSPTVAIIDAVPRDRAQFTAVFGDRSAASVTALSQVRQSSHALEQLSRETKRADDVGTQISQTKSAIVLIVGHNEGGIFKTPSGRAFRLGELQRKCAQLRKLCVFLTCSARRYLRDGHGPSVDITAVQAARIARAIAGLVANAPTARARAAADTSFAGERVIEDPWKLMADLDAVMLRETDGRGRLVKVGVLVGTFLVIVAVEVVVQNNRCQTRDGSCPPHLR